MTEEPTFQVFAPDDEERCGEKCDRKADIEVGGLVYCAPCLVRQVTLGSLLQEAMERAEELHD